MSKWNIIWNNSNLGVVIKAINLRVRGKDGGSFISKMVVNTKGNGGTIKWMASGSCIINQGI